MLIVNYVSLVYRRIPSLSEAIRVLELEKFFVTRLRERQFDEVKRWQKEEQASLFTQYRDIIEKVLTDYADFLGSDAEVQVELVFDRDRDRYLLVETGWQDGYRIYGNVLHLDIIDGHIWIQHDGTEEGIAIELVAAGIPKEQIVLGFRSLEQRKLTEFAIG